MLTYSWLSCKPGCTKETDAGWGEARQPGVCVRACGSARVCLYVADCTLLSLALHWHPRTVHTTDMYRRPRRSLGEHFHFYVMTEPKWLFSYCIISLIRAERMAHR